MSVTGWGFSATTRPTHPLRQMHSATPGTMIRAAWVWRTEGQVCQSISRTPNRPRSTSADAYALTGTQTLRNVDLVGESVTL